MGYNPQESIENTINTMGTLLGVHPIVLWTQTSNHRIYKNKSFLNCFLKGFLLFVVFITFEHLSHRLVAGTWNKFIGSMAFHWQNCREFRKTGDFFYSQITGVELCQTIQQISCFQSESHEKHHKQNTHKCRGRAAPAVFPLFGCEVFKNI